MHGKVQGLINVGADELVVAIECHISNSLPNIVIVGSAAKAVDESKKRLCRTSASSNFQVPRKLITINLAPADVPKDDSGFDLAIAAAILTASNPAMPKDHKVVAFVGELGLDSSVRAACGILFFDGVPEFSRMTLESLRQPLEDRTITVARAKNTVQYPADFILVATANPCPRDYNDTARHANTCAPSKSLAPLPT